MAAPANIGDHNQHLNDILDVDDIAQENRSDQVQENQQGNENVPHDIIPENEHEHEVEDVNDHDNDQLNQPEDQESSDSELSNSSDDTIQEQIPPKFIMDHVI